MRKQPQTGTTSSIIAAKSSHKHPCVLSISIVRRAITELHDAGSVFGDLRAPNVMFQRDTKKALLIDFDWSGKEGVVHYP